MQPDAIASCDGLAGNKLQVSCLQPRLVHVELSFGLAPHKWYHIMLTHSAGSTLTYPTVRLYVNGSMEASVRLKFPKVRPCTMRTECGILLLSLLATCDIFDN